MWYVMLHLNPQWIETMLHRESRGELQDQEQLSAAPPLEPFEFFVPFQFMRPDTSDDVRALFHSFVFIKASEERLRQILASEWNTRSRLRLYFYRDRSGQAIMVSDTELQQLKATLLNRQLKVFFGLPIDPVGQMAVGDAVTLLIPEWRGREGRIERITLHKGRVSMVVGINILGFTKSIHFEDLHDGDVIFSDHDTEQLMSGNLIANIEDQLVTILGHWFVNPTEEKKRRDYPRLNRLLALAGIKIDDDDDRRRFTALMLMCAVLLDERPAITRLQSQVESTLLPPPSSLLPPPSSLHPPQSPIEAIESLSLFLATRNPQYRNAVKAYRKAHPDCPPIIGRLFNQLRNAPTKRPVKE